MESRPSQSDRIALAFVEQYWLDQQRGLTHELAHYLARFPGHETRVAEEYLAIQANDEPEDESFERQIGPYRLIREIGRGGQAVVYLAEGGAIDRRVALKVLRALGATSPYLMRRFRREARAMSKIEHPGICPIYDAGVDRGVAYIAMPFIQGSPLTDRIHRRPKDSRELREAIVVFEQIAKTLHAAHQQGIIHRDIKPGNIMLSEDGDRPVLLDFGLAGIQDDDATLLTQRGDALGTPAYMSPEQVQEGTLVDLRTDIYSLGVTMYEILSGRLPYQGATTHKLMRAIATDSHPAIRKVAPHVPRDLELILEVAMDRSPTHRYQTALDFAEDLRRFRVAEPILARPLSPPLRCRRWIQRNPTATAIMILVGLTLAVTFTLLDKLSTEGEITKAALRVARAGRLATASRDMSHVDPTLALLLAREALTLDTNPETEAQALHALALNHPLAIFTHPALPTASWASCEISQDGRRVAAQMHTASSASIGSGAPLIAVWELGVHEPIRVLRPQAPLRAWHLDDKGHYLTTLEGQGSLLVHDIENDKTIIRRENIRSVHPHSTSNDLILVTGEDQVQRIGPDGELLANLLKTGEAPSPITTATCGLQGEIAIGCQDGSVLAWIDTGVSEIAYIPPDAPQNPMPQGVSVRTVEIAGERIAVRDVEGRLWTASSHGSSWLSLTHPSSLDHCVHLELSPDGASLLAFHEIETSREPWIEVRLWRLDEEVEEPRRIRRLDPQVDRLEKYLPPTRPQRAFAANSQWFNTLESFGMSPDRVRVWGPRGDAQWSLRGAGGIAFANTSPDGRFLRAGGSLGRIHLLDRRGRELTTYDGHRNTIWDLRSTPSDQRFATASFDGTTRLWSSLDPDLERGRLDEFGGLITSASPEGDSLILSGTQGLFLLRNETITALHAPTTIGPNTPYLDAALSPDVRAIVMSTTPNTKAMWLDVESLEVHELSSELVRAVAFFADGDRVALAHEDGSGQVVRLDATVEISWPSKGDAIRRPVCHVTKAGDVILTGHDSGLCRLWSVETGQELLEIQGPKNASGRGMVNFVSVATFSPDDNWIVAGYADGSVRVYSRITGEEGSHPAGHGKQISGLAFSPDGGMAASTSWEGTARVWDLGSGETVLFLQPDVLIAGGVSWTTRNRLVTPMKSATVREWPLDPRERDALIEKHLLRPLTDAERARFLAD